MAGEPASSSPNDKVTLRILIVEDNAFIALDLEGQIQDLGHEVVGIAAMADTAIEAAKTMRPDLAVLDLQLAAGTRGQDVARVLRQELEIPSILMSGSLHLVSAQEREDIRPLAMLSKPMLPHELAKAVQSYFDAS